MDKHAFFASLYEASTSSSEAEAQAPTKMRKRTSKADTAAASRGWPDEVATHANADLPSLPARKRAKLDDVDTLIEKIDQRRTGTTSGRSGNIDLFTGTNGGNGHDNKKVQSKDGDIRATRLRKTSGPKPSEGASVPFYCMDNSTVTNKTALLRSSSSSKASSREATPAIYSDMENEGPLRHKSSKNTRKASEISKPATKSTRKTKTAKVSKPVPEPPASKLPWLQPSAIKSKNTAKSKKLKKSKKLLPESACIFRGLVFYYYPNSTVSPARSFQMQKAIERGATRAEQFGQDVTHIIVDSCCTFPEVLNSLNLPSLPPAVKVVNDYFAPESIEFGYLLSEEQTRFAVKGYVKPCHKVSEATTSAAENALVVQNKSSHITAAEKEPAQRGNVEQPETDELDEAVFIVQRATQDLPMVLSSTDEETWSDPALKHSITQAGDQSTSESRDKQPRWQAAFQCMRSHPLPSNPDYASNESNPNEPTIKLLKEMKSYYERTNDTWRVLSYQRGIAALGRQTEYICTRSQALAIPGIGTRLADKIEEIASTATLRRLEHATSDPNDQALKLFTGIYGAGSVQAQAWITRGFRTLDDLKNSGELTRTQLVGIERWDDFNAKIPRNEVTQHGEFVEKVVKALDPQEHIEIIIGGSYRRGKESSGDIDFLVIGDEAMGVKMIQNFVFDRLVPKLWKTGYLKCALAASHKSGEAAPWNQKETQAEDQENQMIESSYKSPRSKKDILANATKESGSFSKWHGAAALPSTSTNGKEVWRRVDFLVVPAAERGAAILYFTGSALFNRSMRLLARKKGMRLNQKGLWGRPTTATSKVGDEKEAQKWAEGALVESRRERKIFEYLGVPWREASERNC